MAYSEVNAACVFDGGVSSDNSYMQNEMLVITLLCCLIATISYSMVIAACCL